MKVARLMNLKKKNRHTLPNLNHTSREMTGWEGGREGREGGREGGREALLGGRRGCVVLCCAVINCAMLYVVLCCGVL